MNHLKIRNWFESCYLLTTRHYHIILAGLFCLFLGVIHQHLSWWMILLVILLNFIPLLLLIHKLVHYLLKIGQSANTNKASLYIFTMVFIVATVVLLPYLSYSFALTLILFFIWMIYYFFKNRNDLFLSGLSLLIIPLFFYLVFFVISYEFKILQIIEHKFYQYHYEKLERENRFTWSLENQTNTYSLSRMGQKSIQFDLQKNLYFHDNNTASSSLDFPAPGILLAAISSSRSNPFAHPSLVLFNVASQNQELAIDLFYEKCREVFMSRKRQGSISNPVFSGKIHFDNIKNHNLAGVCVRYQDLILATQMQNCLFYKQSRGLNLALMTIERYNPGIPLSAVLIEQIENSNL